ncbi:MAG: hypothetical protein FWG13_06505 [Leptospirales bacterium]|nr:hypothetical protein [Leptospirales bacterium]
MKKYRYFCSAFLILAAALWSGKVFPDILDEPWGQGYRESENINIKNVNGKLYAYIVLLFNENPHFVNLIQKDSIPPKIIGNSGFHLSAYKSYLRSMLEPQIENIASAMLEIYLDPDHYTEAQLLYFEKLLTRYNIVLKFSKDTNIGGKRIILDYCIYGKKTEILVKHPFIDFPYKIYNIRPYIYYDEFSTTSSTFYYDMIYINMDEVRNDSIIAAHIMSGKNVDSLFFVGSRVTEDIKFCLKKAFNSKSNIRDEIWETFVIHELTHKMINNRYNYYDQVNGEELSLVSTIYARPFLGLSVMYSYLTYNSINPHRIAATNFVRFVAEKSGKKEIAVNPSLVKTLPESQIKQLARDYFFLIERKLK